MCTLHVHAKFASGLFLCSPLAAARRKERKKERRKEKNQWKDDHDFSRKDVLLFFGRWDHSITVGTVRQAGHTVTQICIDL